MNSLIWILADDRPGNYSQAIGLAAALNRPYEIKKINYNSWSKLPNFLKLNGLCGVDEESKSDLLNQFNSPKIIISAGRKTAAIALYLKKHYGEAFLIHIMNPGMALKKFDLVILPKHDGMEENDNIITSLGALTRIDDNLLKEEYKKFSNLIDKINPPKVGLLIGGSSKHAKFDSAIRRKLIVMVNDFISKTNANLLISTSRRTDLDFVLELKNNFENDRNLFFQWQPGKPNPYFAILQAADCFIVTGDSISMCSEVCSLGKPVYIFNPPEICSKKHLKLHDNLFSGGYAKQLNDNLDKIFFSQENRLNETNRIGMKINKILELKNL
jgi:mitochondrial fission protein ELM1